MTLLLKLSCLPKKFHRYVLPSIRRVYFEGQDNDLAKELEQAQQELEEARKHINALERDQEMLMKQCEKHMKKSQAYADKEHIARVQAVQSKQIAEETKKDYGFLKGKYENLKKAYKEL
jgi:chromosome segregation ATPase